MRSSNYLAVASGHVDALIDYVLDVKPYHVKLAHIVEEHLLEENLKVKTHDDHRILTFLGADLLPEDSSVGGRPRATSWQATRISNGVTRTLWLPPVARPKFLSHLGQATFKVGVDDDLQIKGLQLGTPQCPGAAAFSQRRHDGVGITRVFLNDRHLQEGHGFVISHGVFSFETYPNARWKQSNLAPGPASFNDKLLAYGEQPGELAYDDVLREFGSIRNIQGDPTRPLYEEWTLEYVSGSFPPQLTVTGSHSGLVGIATFGTTFTYSSSNTFIQFDFVEVAGFPPLTPPPISPGNFFTLTPRNKITVHPAAPQETWSLIKVNPMCLGSPITFVPAVADAPSMQVHARDLIKTPESYWQLMFINSETYELRAFEYDHQTMTIGSALPGYPKVVSLLNGCAYKDELIHLTLIPTARGFLAGDQFYFSIRADKPTYLVFGSESGFLPVSATSPTGSRAEVGRWFFNGKVGFKVPELRCWPTTFSPTIATSPDGMLWETVVSSDALLTDVTYVGGVNGFLATGNNSVVTSSIDGQSWASDVVSLAQDGQRAIVVGENGLIVMTTIATGPPPVTYEWFRRNSHTNEDLNAITFVNGFFINPPPTIVGLFVVVGDNGTLLTSANGDAWAVRTTGTTNDLNDVAWKGNPGNIIVVVGDAGTILTSTDAITWTPRASGVPHNLNSIIYAENLDLFVAAGDGGTILTSPDGINWTNAGLVLNDNLLDVAYQPITLPSLPKGKLVAIGQQGTVAISTDGGVTWTTGAAPSFRSITFGNGIFICVGGGPIPVNQQFQQLAPVHPMIEPSVYTITFVDSQRATVINNLYGYRRGLRVNEDWSDEFVSFRLSDTPTAFTRGDVVRVYVAPAITFSGVGACVYDVPAYDVSDYDSASMGCFLFTRSTPDYFGQSLGFPPFHSHGTVLVGEFDRPNGSALQGGEKIVIDKALFDVVRLRLPNVNPATAPLLASRDGWVPLEFRHFDRVDPNDIPSSVAEFSDLATRIDAYLASDPTYHIFTLRQPRHRCTDQPGSCELTFSEDFLNDYLPFGTRFTVQVQPEQSYGQKLGVKVTEDLKIAARFRLHLFDGPQHTNDARLSRGPFEPPIIRGPYNRVFSPAAYNAFPHNPELWYPITLITAPHPYPFTINITGGGFEEIDGLDVLGYDILPYDGALFSLGASGNGVVAFSTDPGDRPWLRHLDGVGPLVYNVGTYPLVSGWHQPGNFTQRGQFRNLSLTAGPTLNNFPLSVAADFFVAQVTVNGAVQIPGVNYTVDRQAKILTFTAPLTSGDAVRVGVVEAGPSIHVYNLDPTPIIELFTISENETTFTLATPMPFTVTEVFLNGAPINFSMNYINNVITVLATTSSGDQLEVILFEFV